MRFVGIALILVVLFLASCGGTTGRQIPLGLDQARPAPQALNLPMPSELTRSVQANSDTQADGSSFLPAPCNCVLGIGSTAEYLPNWPSGGGGPYDCAYAVYGFTIDLGESFYSLQVDWDVAPTGWIGLSNYGSDSWQWVNSSTLAMLPGSLADFVSPANEMYVVVAAIGVGTFLLNELRLMEISNPELTNLFFLHHSTGQGIINGGVRDAIAMYNAEHSVSFEFWDHCYTWASLPDWPGGLVDASGNATGTNYGDCLDATDPPDLRELWCNADPYYGQTRSQILENHQVIAFKSCFPAAAISSASMLQDYKDYYLDMRDVFDGYPNHLFVVMGFPPLHPDETSVRDAGYARQFIDWLGSPGYLAGHPNVVFFPLFDLLASDGSDGPANMLRTSYQQEYVDSHPNAQANAEIAPVFANFLCDQAWAFSH